MIETSKSDESSGKVGDVKLTALIQTHIRLMDELPLVRPR